MRIRKHLEAAFDEATEGLAVSLVLAIGLGVRFKGWGIVFHRHYEDLGQLTSNESLTLPMEYL